MYCKVFGTCIISRRVELSWQLMLFSRIWAMSGDVEAENCFTLWSSWVKIKKIILRDTQRPTRVKNMGGKSSKVSECLIFRINVCRALLLHYSYIGIGGWGSKAFIYFIIPYIYSIFHGVVKVSQNIQMKITIWLIDRGSTQGRFGLAGNQVVKF